MSDAVEMTAELRRIIALPRRTLEDYAGLVDELTEVLKTPNGTMRLRPVQALALHDIGTQGGAFLPIGVGEGKTLIFAMAAYLLDADPVLGLLPAGLIQKTQRELAHLSEHWRIPKNLRLFSYDMLGRAQAAKELEDWAPGAIIADEVHRLKNLDAACTKRVARYMAQHPETAFVGMSGTIMRDSIYDFAHIAFWALKDNAPLPMQPHELAEWASALDEIKKGKPGEEYTRTEPGALLSLCSSDELREQPVVAARRGFRRRLIETPGVVAAAGEGENVGSSIYVKGIIYDVKQITNDHFRKLRDDWERPDGKQFEEGVEVWACARQLAAGMHYRWVDQSVWKQVTPLINLASKLPESEALRLVSALRSETEKGIGKVRAAAARSSCERLGLGADTALTSRDTRDSAMPKVATAQSAAGRPPSIEASGKVERPDLSSITTTILARFGGSCASLATEPLLSLVTASTAYQELLRICFELSNPPESWMKARKAWGKFVRGVLSRSHTLDSPQMVVDAIDAGNLRDEGGVLEKWRAVRHTFQPSTVPVWHDDSVLELAAKWGKQPGIIWTEHGFFGRRLAKETGLPYYGAKGTSASGEYIEDSKSKTIIASIDANRDGKNLQHKWNRNLIISPPDGWDVWQQCIARTHRPGQKADEVVVDVLLGCKEHVSAWRKAMAGTHAAVDTVGGTPKLLLADVSFPSEAEILCQRGDRW